MCQSGPKMGIEMHNYWKYIMLALTFVKIWEFSTLNKVLNYKFINEPIKYWTPDINKNMYNM